MRYLVCLIVVVLSCFAGCVKFSCYSNSDRAIELAHQFCSKGNNNQTLCDSLEIDGRVCGISRDGTTCMALGSGIKTFIAVKYYECQHLEEQKICQAKDYCDWTFADPLEGRYGDFYRPYRPKSQ